MSFSDKMMESMEKYVMPVAAKMASQRHLSAMKNGMMATVPFLIIGSIFMIIANFPVNSYLQFLKEDPTGILIKQYLSYPAAVTFDAIAIISLLGIAYELSKSYGLDGFIGSAISLVSFLLVTPMKIVAESGEAFAGVLSKYLGSQGLFVAIIMAIASVEIYRYILQKGITIKMPESVPEAVSKSFAALIPAGIVIVFALLIKIGLEMTTFGNMHNIVATLLTVPLTKVSGTLAGAIIITLLMQILWCCGIHGPAIVWSVLLPVLNVLMDQNRVAFDAGLAIPNVLTKEWFNIFIMIGGSGGTLGLTALMAFSAKSKQLKEIGKLSVGPALFNINEPVLFGAPIVMNPVMMIPFVLGPVLVTILSYIVMDIGIVARPIGVVPWTSPVLIGGFLITGGFINAAILQLINLLILTGIYYPFFRIFDKQLCQEEADFEAKKANNA